MAKNDIVLQMKGITKVFPRVIANDNISFDIKEGEIHALLGENGAGKSTLMNVLSGLYKPDSGEIYIRGKKMNFTCPKDAIVNGIGMIHQHFKLIKAFTVTENIVMGDDAQPMFYNKKATEQKIKECSEKYNMEIDPSARIWQLAVGEQQTVEIIKVLYRNADILVLDEPTSVLTPIEAQKLFENLKLMAAKGCAIVIITHKLAEVCEIADRVTVLRKGKSVATLAGDDVNYRVLSEYMMNASEFEKQSAPENTVKQEFGTTVLRTENLEAYNAKHILSLDKVTFDLKSGEILGVAGVSGNGQKELAEVLSGMQRPSGGKVFMQDKDITIQNARKKFDEGICFVPEDRLGTGLVANMNIPENLILKDYYSKKRGKSPFINYKKLESEAERAVREYDISVANIKAPVRLVSGGNLQKVLLAREINANPKVLIAAYPVRGLDMAAADFVFNRLVELKNKGCAVILIAEDLDSLFKYADRIMVLYRGRIMGIEDTAKLTISDVGMMMMGTSMEEVKHYEVLGHF